MITNQRFMPFGAPREVGVVLEDYTDDGYTDLSFTGQRAYLGQSGSAGFGLLDFNARFYDPYLYRWTQPDTLISDFLNPQSYNRYAYTLNDPVKYIDPSGHHPCMDGICESIDDYDMDSELSVYQILYLFENNDYLTQETLYMAGLYLKFQSTPGFWNDDGDFTMNDFIAMGMYTEMYSVYYSWLDIPKNGGLVASTSSNWIHFAGNTDYRPIAAGGTNTWMNPVDAFSAAFLWGTQLGSMQNYAWKGSDITTMGAQINKWHLFQDKASNMKITNSSIANFRYSGWDPNVDSTFWANESYYQKGITFIEGPDVSIKMTKNGYQLQVLYKKLDFPPDETDGLLFMTFEQNKNYHSYKK